MYNRNVTPVIYPVASVHLYCTHSIRPAVQAEDYKCIRTKNKWIVCAAYITLDEQKECHWCGVFWSYCKKWWRLGGGGGLGIMYMFWARICKPFKEPCNVIDSQPGGPVRQPNLSYRPARLYLLVESIPRYRFLGSLNVYKYGLNTLTTAHGQKNCVNSDLALSQID